VNGRARRVATLLAWAALATGCESVFGIGDLPLPSDGGSQDSFVAGDGGGQVDTGGPPGDGTTPTDGFVAIDSPTSMDGPVGDAPLDSPSAPDSPPPDAADDAAPAACYANAAFVPVTWAPPATFPNPACNAAQIAAYLACFPNCSTFRADLTNGACLGCIETDVGAAAHGPIITSGGQPVEVNFGGCVAHYDGNMAAGSCGNLENNASDCASTECGTCADFGNPQTGGATDHCEATAFGAGKPCSADTVMPACANELTDGGVAAACNDLRGFLGSWCGGQCTEILSTPPPATGGAACPQAGTCWPHAETALSPAWVPPVGAHLGKCTATQVSGFYTACLDALSTTTTCSAWTQDTANTACFGCLYTDSTATSYGAVIGYSQSVIANEAGCLALVEPCNAPCAQAVSDMYACEDAACGSTFCTDFASYNTCASQADACTSCSGYSSSAQCLSSITGTAHPAESICNLTATTFQPLYTSIATFMCGS
jgi:hypothetical protein